jgi:hypothetical protein
MVRFPQLSDCTATDDIHFRLKCKIRKFTILINKISSSHVNLSSQYVLVFHRKMLHVT